jgi:four helix bundle protein
MENCGEKGLDGLHLWHQTLDFAEKVYRQALPFFPPEEKWALAAQLRRAVQSIPANIAEGYGRNYYQETIRFCYIARGSLEETYSHLTIAHRLGYLTEKDYRGLVEDVQALRKSLNGYVGFLKRSKRGANEPGALPVIRETLADYQTHPDENDLADWYPSDKTSG